MELLNSIFSQLGINKTFFIQFALVLVSCAVLSKLLFNNVLATLILRDSKVKGARKDAGELMFEYDSAKKEYDSKWTVYQDKADQIKKNQYDESRKKVQNIVEKSKEESEVFLNAERSRIGKIIELEQGKLSKESPAFIKSIKNKLFEVVN